MLCTLENAGQTVTCHCICLAGYQCVVTFTCFPVEANVFLHDLQIKALGGCFLRQAQEHLWNDEGALLSTLTGCCWKALSSTEGCAAKGHPKRSFGAVTAAGEAELTVLCAPAPKSHPQCCAQ